MWQKFANFGKIATFSKNKLDSFVDLEKPEKMRLWLQNFVSIQPRTSLEKSDVLWPTIVAIELLLDGDELPQQHRAPLHYAAVWGQQEMIEVFRTTK